MIGDSKWISKFKDISSKYKLYDVIFKLKSQLKKLSDYQLIFYIASLIVHLQLYKSNNFNINIDDMIFLKPNYKFLINTDKLDETNINYKFGFSLDNKLINLGVNDKILDYNSLIQIEEEFLILVRDVSENDNLILIIPTPKLEMKGGQFVDSNNAAFQPSMQAGVGYNPTVHTRNGYDIGQYFAASLDIDDAPEQYQDHNSNQYPGDPLFGVKKLEGLIAKKKQGNTNFEKGFSTGFDNGYNKGYYFGYSSAAAYLYRYYKKFYREYMENYRQKLANKQLEQEAMEEVEQELEEDYEYDDMDMEGGFLWSSKEEKAKKEIINDELKRLTGHDFTYEPFATDEQVKELENDPMYKGLPDYMMPENTFSLIALQPRKQSLLEVLAEFFLPTKKTMDPKLHCKRPSLRDLNKMLRLNFHPKFRDAIVSADRNWNERVFRKSCNKYSLMLMKYCPTENHAGVEFDPKVGFFHKVCKRKKDEQKFCVIM